MTFIWANPNPRLILAAFVCRHLNFNEIQAYQEAAAAGKLKMEDEKCS